MVLISMFVWTSCEASKKAGPDADNIILITISSLRADHFGCMGYQRKTTPQMDAFAGKGVLFTNAFGTSGWTMPNHASIFTSLFPKTHQVKHIKHSLSQKYQTLAEILRENGYFCAGFTCNPRLGTEYGFGQGFDLYDDYTVPVLLKSVALESTEVDVNKTRTNHYINDLVIRWLQRVKQQPFFLFVHYYDPHWDFLPPAPYDTMFDQHYKGTVDGRNVAKEPLFSNPPSEEDIRHIIALYDGEIRQTDSDVGEVLDILEKTNLMKNTIVIIVGDHGESFYEHGHTSHHGLYEELIHVPMMMRIPQKIVKKKIPALVSQVDIMPTILDYAGISPSADIQGKSLKPLIEGSTESIRDFIIAEYQGGAIPDCYVCRSPRYKVYIGARNAYWSHDLSSDPQEQNEIRSQSFIPEMNRLYKALTGWKNGN